MQVASLELCKELYELSGWSSQITHNEPTPSSSLVGQVPICPAYTLGYLLRKLPVTVPNEEVKLNLTRFSENFYTASYAWEDDFAPYGDGNTPEDAACKLAIELWKQGVLK